uniref:Uncharacterized protein n=1 Tax=Lepeophtheirus salmonis TaxID=72036 RepID=A0A0K2UV56_LEPSM
MVNITIVFQSYITNKFEDFDIHFSLQLASYKNIFLFARSAKGALSYLKAN